ncbi:hypothetical protein ABW19_dt0203368 [Dactylella cylindrospora]|nr:hypothetical protein ABW19_dt0203368 [Dactylella cylindrospora]
MVPRAHRSQYNSAFRWRDRTRANSNAPMTLTDEIHPPITVIIKVLLAAGSKLKQVRGVGAVIKHIFVALTPPNPSWFILKRDTIPIPIHVVKSALILSVLANQ